MLGAQARDLGADLRVVDGGEPVDVGDFPEGGKFGRGEAGRADAEDFLAGGHAGGFGAVEDVRLERLKWFLIEKRLHK